MRVSNFLAVAVLLYGLASAVPAAQAPLVDVITTGGLTPRGMGHGEMKIDPDGTLNWYVQTRDETIPFGGTPGKAGGFNGWFHKKMKPEDLAALQKAIASTDFDGLHPARAMRPSAADGVDVIMIFSTPQGPRTLNLWQLRGQEPPVVARVEDIEKTCYGR